MADKKISQLNSYTNYSYTADNFVIVDGAAEDTKKINADSLFNNISGDIQCSGIVKSNRINVNGGKLYVDNTANNEFVKIGAYGTGSFFGAGGANNGATYHLAVGAGGKIVESERVVTFQLSGSGYLNLKSTPKTLIEAPGSGRAVFVEEVYFFQSFNSGDASNHATNQTGRGAFATGNSAGAPFRIGSKVSGLSGSPSTSAVFPRDAIKSQDTFFLYKDSRPTEDTRKIFINRPIVLDTFPTENNFTNINQVPGGSHFIKIKYSLFQAEADFRDILGLSVVNTTGHSGIWSLE